MRLSLPLLLSLAALSTALPQGGGFFGGFNRIVNRFNPFRSPSRPQSSRPQSSRPQPSRPSFSAPPQPARQPQSFSRPSSNSFSSSPSSSNLVARPSFSSSSSSSFPSSSFSSSPSSSSSSFFSRPSSSSSSSSFPSSSSSSALSEIAAPSQPPSPSSSSGRGNHQWNGGDYLLSWREGQNSLSWSAAQRYCSSRGMRMVSLDSRDKAEHFMRQVAADNSPYFWAGGRISRDKRTLTWENGRREGISRGNHPWSFTGSRGAQPDGQGSEDCLAILNNFYNDGVKFHDVGCSHTKPTVCEA